MQDAIVIGGLYRHHSRAGLYRVLHLAVSEGDLREVVVYLSLVNGKVWVRPAEDFLSLVQLADGRCVDRFKLVQNEIDERQVEMFQEEDEAITLDELPVRGTEMVCSICMNTNGSNLFCICQECGSLVCPACISEKYTKVGRRVCLDCDEEISSAGDGEELRDG